MQNSPLKKLCGFLAASAVAVMLIGCRGPAGQTGANGANGSNGSNGTNGTNGTTYAMDASKLSADEWSNLTLKGSVINVTAGGAPTVNLKIIDGKGVPVAGLAQKSADGRYPNFGFALAKLIPATTTSPSRWVSYSIFSATPAAGTVPKPGFSSVESSGTLKDNLDGTYTYTFNVDPTKVKSYVDASVEDASHLKADLDDVSWAPNLPHRLIVLVGGQKPGTTREIGTSANLYYDFIPATGQPVATLDPQRIIVDTSACNSCHSKLSMHAGHIPAIQDTHLCVACHTDQHKYGSTESLPASGNMLLPGIYGFATQKLQGMGLAHFPNMVHKIHMGEELYYQGYNQFGVLYNETTYPQDQRNCVKCHSASTVAPQGDNWKNNPSRMACGACHDQVIWATGANHGATGEGGPQLSDQNCTNCHKAADIQTYHVPIAPQNPAFATGGYVNGSDLAAYPGNIPPGAAKITYDFKSVQVNASQQPVFTFRFLKDGQPVVFNTYGGGKTEMMDGFVGSPSVYLVMSVPQDGTATPADWNASASGYMKKIWNGTATGAGAGTFSGPDGNGYYTIVLTGVTVPASATQITGGIGYTYNKNSQPLTQTGVAGFPYNTTTMMGGLSVPAPNVTKLVSGTLPAGFAPQKTRRTIVSNQKCNDCHAVLGVFTKTAYHAGERNDAPTCAFCHTTNRTSSGWSANASTFIHGIHGGSKRTVAFNWHAPAPGKSFASVTYPGVLSNCEACHVAGSYDFANSANAAAVPNMLWSTVAASTLASTGTTYSYSPYITKDFNYGSAFAFSLATGATTPAAGTTLVTSPYTASCVSCHDSTMAVNHMQNNGGSFYAPRSTVWTPATGALVNNEQCFLCHSAGKLADVRVVHNVK